MINLFDALKLVSDINKKDKVSKKRKTSKKSSKKKLKENFDENNLFSLFNLVDKTPVVINDSQKSSVTTMITLLDEFTEKAKTTVSKLIDFIVEKKPQDPIDMFIANINAIKTLKALNTELAGPKEQKIISQYSGWGALASRFNDGTESNKMLESLLSNQEYLSAKKSTLTGFYTDYTTVKFIYSILERFGFEKGRILEPSLGVGSFLKYMPSQMYFNSQIVGIEIEDIAANISKHLFQSAKIIHNGYQNCDLKNDSFDCIIGNVPFGDIKIFDDFDSEFNKNALFIHDYYFLKSIKKIRDKGLIAFITTSGTMDKKNSKVREAINAECDFLGAVRLGSGSFKGTSVVADIIFLQKNLRKNENIVDVEVVEDDDEIKQTSSRYELDLNWINSVKFNDSDVNVNEYFINNPQMVIGELTIGTNQFGNCINVIASDDVKKSLNATMKYFKSDLYVTPLNDIYMFEEESLMINNDECIKNGEILIVDGKLYQKQTNKLIPLSYTGDRELRLLKYVEIKDLIKLLIQEQLNGCSDDCLTELQYKLNKKYDSFVERYGFIGHRTNKKLLNEDILYTLTSSIETYNDDKQVYGKADIFSKRTICVASTFEPETINDAVMLSYSTYGFINVEFMADKLGYTLDEFKIELLATNLFFLNPVTNLIEYRDEYLSGNVKEKLMLAKEHNASNPAFEKNIKALELVQPEYITDVVFSFTSTWIPNEIKESFIADTLSIPKDKVKLIYNAVTGYSLIVDCYVPYELDNGAWGTERRSSLNIIRTILNLGEMTIWDTIEVDGKEKRVKNAEETQLAMCKETAWKLAFIDYINNDLDLLKFITDLYNEKFNCYKEREYHNIFKNLDINSDITLRDYQLKAASRAIISNRPTLLHHSVGAGKSFTSILIAETIGKIGSAMFLDELDDNFKEKIIVDKYSNQIQNTVRVKGKTLIVVPNHLAKSGNFAREYLTLYPNANILSTTPDDFRKSNRRKLIAKIATGDWTAVIIPMSVLGMIPLKPSTELKMLEEDLKELEKTIEFIETTSENRLSVKALEKERENFLVRQKKLNDMHIDDGLLFWEDLGITHIICDEIQAYKNLFISKKVQIKGISSSASKRSSDFFNKIRYQKSKFKGNVLTGLSATPISNSMAEVFVFSKYFLSAFEMVKYGIESFDAFAANFGDINNVMEIDPTGKSFRLVRRFNKFINTKELIDMYRTFADIVNINEQDSISNALPKLLGGQPQVRITNPSEAVTKYIESLIDRAENIKNGKISPQEDNMLKVVLDGRKVAVAPRLVGINEDSAKLKQCAKDLADMIQSYPGTTHLVFLDLGTPNPKKEYSAYDELKEHCIKQGIDENDIKYIHEAKTSVQFTKIVNDFRDAKFKILICSSEKGSTGLNIQDNLKSVSHVDADWKSSVIQQRVGRMIRVGNKNKEVIELRNCMSSSFDAYMWQTIEFKSAFINQLLSGNSSDRIIEDLENETMSYEQCKACASDNPLLFELANINKDIQEITILQKAHKKEILRRASRKESAETALIGLNALEKEVKIDIDLMNDDLSNLILDGYNTSTPINAIESLAQVMKEVSSQKIGSIYGLDLYLEISKDNYTIDRILRIGTSKTRIEWKVYPKVFFETILTSNEIIRNRYSKINEKINNYNLDIKAFNNSSNNSKFNRQDELNNLKLRKIEIETELSK